MMASTQSGSVRIIDAIANACGQITFADLPQPVVSTAVDAITDAVGVAVAGAREPIAEALLSGLPVGPQGGSSALIGLEQMADPATAALINGTLIHALDFDDTNHPAYSHPSSHLVPLLLSAPRGTTGAAAVAAYVVGLEVESRFGHTMNMGHYLNGWHTTGTFGAFAATACAAMLHELSVLETRTALAIAASMSSGLRVNFGTMTKPLHAGLAARHGLEAVMLARAGVTASDDAIDGKHGFLETMAGREGTFGSGTSSWGTLGEEWETVSPFGLAIKPYPACGATHPAIEAALLARKELGGDDIVEVSVSTTKHSSRILVYSRPETGLEGKFSMEFCVAAALVEGAVSLATFSDELVRAPHIRDLIGKVNVSVHPELAENSEFAAEVVVRGASCRTATARVELAKGKRDRWLSRAELAAKFVDCAAPSLGHDRSVGLFDALQELPNLPRLTGLTTSVQSRVAIS